MPQNKKRLWPYFLISFAVLWVGIGYYLYNWWQTQGLEGVLQIPEVRREIEEEFGEYTDLAINLAPRVLGFTEAQTILFLFQNNTEIRPSGGFIGSYAVVRFEKGKMEIIKTEGSENLDWQATEKFKIEPPLPLRKYLGVDRWYFRDSNWSPDFNVSAKRALDFYRAEDGVAGGEINLVIGVTPTVLEEILRVVGPITIQGIEFDAANATEKLEYEVEFGYKDKGVNVENRKEIIGDFMLAVLRRFSATALNDIPKSIDLIETLVRERQLMMYSEEDNLQQIFEDYGLDGRVETVDGDFLMWVDANLGALKTDHAIERELSYVISDGLAKAAMTYKHKGEFDWRTSRYRTYARVFVTNGSVPLDDDVDQGEELGKTWFGKFISVEPGETKELTFNYRLPETVSAQIESGSYKLFAQKQAGTIAPGLTLDLDFDKNIQTAEPAEEEGEWGDEIYHIATDLRVDREFVVNYK